MKKKIGSRQILLLILLLIAAVIPVFVRTPYLLSICVMTFYMASASLAWSILGGLTGQISLGHASFMGRKMPSWFHGSFYISDTR